MEPKPYIVLWDYRSDHVNGRDPVVWTEGTSILIDPEDAAWVNRDRPGTLVDADAPADEPAADPGQNTPDPVPDVPEVPATDPAADQVGGKPRGRGRRTDSAG